MTDNTQIQTASTPPVCPKPGIYHDIPFAEYLRWLALSVTAIKAGRTSMKELKCYLDGERTKKITDEMLQGTAMHCAFMEPVAFGERVVEWRGAVRRGAEWNAFVSDHPNQIILPSGYFANLAGMVKALRREPEIASYQWEDVEVSLVGELHGVPFKARADVLATDKIIDAKATNSVASRPLVKTILNMGYHIQAYCYQQLFNRDKFIFAFVQSAPPFDTRLVELGPQWMKLAKNEVLGVTQQYQLAQKTGKWPGCGNGQVEIFDDVPEYMSDSADEITIGGESAF